MDEDRVIRLLHPKIRGWKQKDSGNLRARLSWSSFFCWKGFEAFRGRCRCRCTCTLFGSLLLIFCIWIASGARFSKQSPEYRKRVTPEPILLISYFHVGHTWICWPPGTGHILFEFTNLPRPSPNIEGPLSASSPLFFIVLSVPSNHGLKCNKTKIPNFQFQQNTKYIMEVK